MQSLYKLVQYPESIKTRTTFGSNLVPRVQIGWEPNVREVWTVTPTFFIRKEKVIDGKRQIVLVIGEY